MTIAAIAIAVFAIWWWSGIGRTQRPNVLIITIDTLRADHLGSYGYTQSHTPTLDSLAQSGTRFTHAAAHAPLTLPSHASIFTGLTPPGHGVRNNSEFVLRDSIPTLAERFRASGYETAAFVSGFPLHRRFGLARGFDLYDDRFPHGDTASVAPYTERRADQTVTAIRGWVESRRSTDEKRPFFLWVHFFDPHRPYDPPEPFRSEYRDHPYDGEVAFVDRQIGELLNLGLTRSPTVVAMTADHGEGLGEHDEPTHGLLLYDTTIRVPLIFVGPGIPRMVAVDTPARHIDIAPTLLDLVRLPPLPGVEGRSLAPSIRRAANLPNEPAYIESMFGRLCCGWAPLYGWRTGHWMYIEGGEPELYDLTADPDEQHNVASSHPAEVAQFGRAVRAAARAASPPNSHTTRESAERLTTLGYFTGSSTVAPSLRNPRTMAGLAERMENAIARERLDPGGAARDLRAVIEADPSNALARRHLAIALSVSHDYAAAIQEADELKRLGDTSVETAILLGECQRLAGRTDEAIRTLEDAARRDSANPDAFDAFGRALVGSGRHLAAKAAFERAVALEPTDAEAIEGLADLSIDGGDFQEARQRLESLHVRDPQDIRVAVKLGTVLVRTGQVQSAIGLFKAVVDASPQNIDALVSLAGALAKAGHSADALPYFERAIAAGAASPLVLNGLAMARLEAGDANGAAHALKQSLARRPDQPDIAAMLRRIETHDLGR